MSEDYERGEDILDIWFDSGSSWMPVLPGDCEFTIKVGYVYWIYNSHRNFLMCKVHLQFSCYLKAMDQTSSKVCFCTQKTTFSKNLAFSINSACWVIFHAIFVVC